MKDRYTEILMNKMNNWGLDKLYEIEDDMSRLKENTKQIVAYLNDIHFSMSPGLAIRRYICEEYATGFDEQNKMHIFALPHKIVKTKDYTDTVSYDIEKDDISEYVELIEYINAKYNTDADGRLSLNISRAEIRRLLRITAGISRAKLFTLSFALHMNDKYTAKFLTDVLAEQTYNFREPKEIIAAFCQSREEYNHYYEYERLCVEFEERAKNADITEKKTRNYTSFARTAIEQEIDSEEMLLDFLISNLQNFYSFSETVCNEFIRLYVKASNALLSSSFIPELDGKSVTAMTAYMEQLINDAVLINPEQLARQMLDCIPRVTSERYKNGKKIVSNDFVGIKNTENGANGGKEHNTQLSKKITKNLPMSDRLWDLIRNPLMISRKDLVLLRFFVFSKDLLLKEVYTANDLSIFIYECNDMLERCGMSRLYPGNRFENLVMLSLLASNPYEMFENLIDYSFDHEPDLD